MRGLAFRGHGQDMSADNAGYLLKGTMDRTAHGSYLGFCATIPMFPKFALKQRELIPVFLRNH